jgi:hypothetical protein
VPVPGTPPADAPVAEPKAAAATLLDPGSDDEESESRAAETVIPGKGSPGYQPTQVSIPVARIAPSAPAPAQPKPPPPAPAPEPPKPTFTAAKPAGGPAPTFSAASSGRPTPPARPATPGRPVPPPSSQRPAYGQGNSAKGYAPPSKGRTTPYPPGTQFHPQGGQGAQYAGPSQASPDLSRQYTPGSGGGAGRRRRPKGGKGRQLTWLVAGVVAAAAIGVGTALALNHSPGPGSTARPGSSTAIPSIEDTPTGFQSIDALNNPSTALPAGWTTKTVTQADAQSAAAGFSIDVPPGWTETRNQLATNFSGPGDLLLEVDLTGQPTTNMLTDASKVEASSVSRFPGYKQLNLQAESVRHTEGAVWKFQWTPAGGVQQTADDIFFAQATSTGVQDYAVYIRSPSSTFSTSLSVLDKMLQTFQT